MQNVIKQANYMRLSKHTQILQATLFLPSIKLRAYIISENFKISASQFTQLIYNPYNLRKFYLVSGIIFKN